MESEQKQRYEAVERANAVAEAHPATGQPGWPAAKAALDAATKALREYSSVRLSSRELGRAQARTRDQLVQRLRDRHMRKIVTIARAQIEPGADAGLPAALRMPRQSGGVTRVIQDADAMMEAARPYEAVFVANGLPADFLAQFQAARDRLADVVQARTVLIGARIGARKGIEMQLRRARRAVDRLDALMRAEFEGEEAILLTWRNAKRIQTRPGGAFGSGGPEPMDGAPDGPGEMAVAA